VRRRGQQRRQLGVAEIVQTARAGELVEHPERQTTKDHRFGQSHAQPCLRRRVEPRSEGILGAGGRLHRPPRPGEQPHEAHRGGRPVGMPGGHQLERAIEQISGRARSAARQSLRGVAQHRDCRGIVARAKEVSGHEIGRSISLR
jgi:hypothetical protein